MTTTAEDIFDKLQTHLLSARQSSFEQFDKAIFTLSAGGLGLSVAFVKDIVPLAHTTCLGVLISSWVLFTTAIFSTLASFVLSQQAIDRQLFDAEQYYLHGKKNHRTKKNPFATATKFCNIVSGICFFAAVLTTILFASFNVIKEQSMSEEKTNAEVHFKGGYVPPRMQADTPKKPERVDEGFVPPQLPKVPPKAPPAAEQPPPPPPPKDSTK